MDFEKSKINQKNKMIFVIRDIKRLFNTISDMTSNKFDINYDYNRLTTLLSDLGESKNYYEELNDIIDLMVFKFYF